MITDEEIWRLMGRLPFGSQLRGPVVLT